MAGFSQPQHFCAAARLFWAFGSMRVSIGSSHIFMGSRIFLFEVLRRSDFQRKKCFGHFGGRIDPPNLENAPKATKLVYFRPWSYSQKNVRIIFLDTIEEPLARGFQNTPFFNQSLNLCTLVDIKNQEFSKFSDFYGKNLPNVACSWSLIHLRKPS